jgi:RHH-type rel operon transcriptional repressor/antitoxin RelB
LKQALLRDELIIIVQNEIKGGIQMRQINIRIDNALISRLECLVMRTGRTKSFYVKEALKEHLEDLEDIYLAQARLNNVKSGETKVVSWERLKERNGL